MDDTLTGQIIDGYKIGRLIGRGGMGEVYEVDQADTTTPMAIKILRGDHGIERESIERFLREMTLMESLSHANIIPIYSSGHADINVYFTMRLIRGKSLTDLINEGQLTPSFVWRVLSQLLDGLAYGHSQGIIHRDIKPDNVLIEYDDNGQIHVFLGDFGISKKPGVDRTLTQAGSIMGTPKYISPEAVLGEKMDERADVYSIAVVTYEMLLGTVPFDEAHPHLTAMAHVTQQIPPPIVQNPDFPLPLDDVIMHGLSKEREKRIQSIPDFKKAFGDAMDELTDEEKTTSYWIE